MSENTKENPVIVFAGKAASAAVEYAKKKENRPSTVGFGVFGVSMVLFSGMIVPIIIGVVAGSVTNQVTKKTA